MFARVTRTPIDTVLRCERVANIVNGLLLLLSGVLAFIELSDITHYVLAMYITLFSCMLLSVELRVEKTEPLLRRLFGFLFSDCGRAAFLLFVGTITFGLDGLDAALVIGVLTILNSCFSCFVICAHPDFVRRSRAGRPTSADTYLLSSAARRAQKHRSQTLDRKPTQRPQDLDDDAVIAWLDAHPELAAEALEAGTASVVQQPPAAAAVSCRNRTLTP